jgi:hypothetical protein
MVNFKMLQYAPENWGLEETAQLTISVSGQTIKVRSHSGTFSGRVVLSSEDNDALFILASNVSDLHATMPECELVSGPTWYRVYRCSFISPASYRNTNPDEDDWQGCMFSSSDPQWKESSAGKIKTVSLNVESNE